MKIRNILIYTINVLALIFLVIFIQNIENNQDSIISYNSIKQLNSSYIIYIEPEKEIIAKEIVVSEPEKTQKENITSSALENQIINQMPTTDNNQEKENDQSLIFDNVLETFTGKITGYGPDCYGCTSNKTASGYYVGEGNIYYQDTKYGSIRIVAGDKKYPFGTIVKLSNLSFSEPIIAIVLDRGGGIGLDKKIQFDLLFDSEKNGDIGILSNVRFDILRLGY